MRQPQRTVLPSGTRTLVGRPSRGLPTRALEALRNVCVSEPLVEVHVYAEQLSGEPVGLVIGCVFQPDVSEMEIERTIQRVSQAVGPVSGASMLDVCPVTQPFLAQLRRFSQAVWRRDRDGGPGSISSVPE